VKPRTLRFGFKGLILILAATNVWRHSWSQTAQTPTFPSGTQLITVDAVVVDNKGSPVVGLTKDDFFLQEDREHLLAFVGGVQGRNTNPATPLMTEYEALRIALYNDDLSLRRAMGRYYNQGACAAPPYPCEQKVRADAQENQSRNQGLREASLAAIDRSIEGMARLHGRKSVLLLSEGFIHDAAPEDPYHRLVRAAQRANAAIYFIDVRGLEALPASASAEAARDVGLNPLAGATNQQEAIRKAMEAKDLVTHERFAPELTVGVETMADETGGLIVRNTNDLSGWLNRISTESRSYYLLGYHPAVAKGAGFRKIEVKVKRAGVHVRARKGYYSPGPEAKDVQTPGSASGTVAGGFVPRDEVPLRLATYILEPGAEQKTRVVAVTEINVSGLAFAEREGQQIAQLDVRLEAIPRDGGKAQGRRLSIETKEPGAAETPPTGFWRPLRVDLALPPGVYQVRATVTDLASGKAGAASQRIVVPDPSAFHVSTPILSTVTTPAAEGGGQPVPAPVAHDRFASAEGQQLFCAFQVFGAAKDASTGHYDVVSRFVLKNHEGQTLAAPDPRPIAFSASGQSQQVLVLPLAKLPAGAYELALTVEDRIAGKKEELVETFTAEDAPVAARATPPPSAPVNIAPAAPVPRAGRAIRRQLRPHVQSSSSRRRISPAGPPGD
jgi:VWFA-related protein